LGRRRPPSQEKTIETTWNLFKLALLPEKKISETGRTGPTWRTQKKSLLKAKPISRGKTKIVALRSDKSSKREALMLREGKKDGKKHAKGFGRLEKEL